MNLFDFGPHTPFILGSYASGAVLLAALTGWLMWDGRRLAAQLAALEARRSSSSSS